MNYFGNPSATIENQFYRLEYLQEAGPRIVRLTHKASGCNLLAELPDFKLDSPLGDYKVLGGHRFWVAPETWDTCYHADVQGAHASAAGHRVTLERAGDPPLNLHKELLVELQENEPVVRLTHLLRNDAQSPITCALWGITMLKPGGTAVLPLLQGTNGSDGLTPDRAITLWPYTHLGDARLELSDEVIFIHTAQGDTPFKVGARIPAGWLAYLHEGVCFVKKANFDPAEQYPDFGSNLEVYTNGTFIELETLSGLHTLHPGVSARHVEEWRMFPHDGTARDLFTKLNHA